MNIKNKLKELAHYIERTRQVGHTTAMIRGAQNVDKVLVLSSNFSHATELCKKIPNADVVPLTSNAFLRGYNLPLLLDNAVIWELCQSASAEIERLEKEIENLKNNITITFTITNDTLQ